MEVQFKEKKVITATSVDAIEGSFALDTIPFRFENCRERFGKQWNAHTKGFYFKHPSHTGKNIAAFIVRTEEILGKKRHSKFAETNWDTILWVEPSVFWRCFRIRRSLFTILVRAGWNYSGTDDYERVLFREAYLYYTQSAVRRFLFGFTKYKGPNLETFGSLESMGWRSVFAGRDDVYIKSILVRSGKNPYQLSYVNKFLWS